ncbi:MAG: hypothetical protein KME03_04395 [Aphanocapsa lilacina HA4352-LM1]|jgi:hypothetical protein|nr:hypothetical protein [Aphanocapsa lilacina HA4352-LM1]
MPGKRAHYARALVAKCPYCGQRVHRLNSQKFYLQPEETADADAPDADAAKTQAQKVTPARSWIEEFYCPEHGRLWLHIERLADGAVRSRLPEASEWKKTKLTIDPDHINPSVSAYTLRHSRQASPHLLQRYFS